MSHNLTLKGFKLYQTPSKITEKALTSDAFQVYSDWIRSLDWPSDQATEHLRTLESFLMKESVPVWGST